MNAGDVRHRPRPTRFTGWGQDPRPQPTVIWFRPPRVTLPENPSLPCTSAALWRYPCAADVSPCWAPAPVHPLDEL